MILEFREITIRDIYEAIETNGLGHLRGMWYTNEDGKPTAACILGQGAINLGVHYDSLNEVLNKHIRVPRKNIPVALRKSSDFENSLVDLGLGSVLVWMNDRWTSGEPDTETLQSSSVLPPKRYTYSWKQLLNYAKKHMEPYFDDKVVVQTYTF